MFSMFLTDKKEVNLRNKFNLKLLDFLNKIRYIVVD